MICKEPVPGRVKTRLCPPCSPDGAAAIADTLAAVAATPATRRVVALDGRPGAWLDRAGGHRFSVIAQRGDGLGARLAAAVDDCFADGDGPVVVVGMDTPQLAPEHLTQVLADLDAGADAVLGPAEDGGYWCIGLARPLPGAFDGVPMSTDETGVAQHARLVELGATVATAARLRDVDLAADARAVAAATPGSRFAAAVAEHLPG